MYQILPRERRNQGPQNQHLADGVALLPLSPAPPPLLHSGIDLCPRHAVAHEPEANA